MTTYFYNGNRISAPITFRSNEPMFYNDTISLKTERSTQNAQRWELSFQLTTIESSSLSLVGSVFRDAIGSVDTMIMPQLPSVDEAWAAGSMSATATYSAGTTIIDISAGVPVFPQTLYTPNDQGFVVDAYAMSSLWQDDAGTIPATAHNDPVALWKDNSGSTNGVDHSTAVLADRPNLQIVGNRRTILSDGISDKLTSVTRDFTGKDAFTACFAIRSLDTNASSNPVWAAHDLNNGLRLIYAPTSSGSFPSVRFQTDNNSTDVLDAPGPPPLDMVIIVEGDIPNGTLKLWIDGTLVASETGVSFVDDWQTGVSRLFSDGGVFGEEGFAKLEMARGMEISRGLTASEFTDLLNWGQAGLDGTVVTVQDDVGSGVIPAGSFIKFSNHSKVYLTESTVNGSGSTRIHPGLVQPVPSSTRIQHGSNCLLTYSRDVNDIKGITFSDGILSNAGTVNLVEEI